MRKYIHRFVSVLLVCVMIATMIPTMSKPVYAASQNQLNMVARADYLYGLTWTCKQTVSGWRGSYTFSQGSTYHLPYGQPINSGKYIGFGVSIQDFLTAANTKGSIFYTSRSTYTDNGSSSVYYAMDCSAFVSWCWGTDRKTTYSLTLVATDLGAPTASNVSKLQLGDALNSRSAGHVVLVTGLTYSGSTLTKIEITEQTPPQLKRSTYTPSSLASKYSSSYTILRYSGSVPAAPSTSGGSSTNAKYYPACAADCTSIVTALNAIGVDSSKAYRTIIAEANGITNYTGTAEQNVALLDLMKAGKLIDPEYTEDAAPAGYYPACDSSCTTLVEALDSIGVDSSKEFRTTIAKANGITNYTGTAEQNTQMLQLLKAGMLIDPNSASGGNTGGNTGTGVFVNGYQNGYTGGMAGDGKIYAHGLDVSAWQGSSLDFKAIKSAGYDYVILRAGTTNGKDECFETFYTNARNAGLDIGAYYYSYATTVAGAQTDANNMLQWISGKTFEYPLYFDYEDASQDNLSATTAKNICLTFCDALAQAGYLAGVYTGYSRSTDLPMDSICAKYEIWIARYYDYTYETLSPSYSKKYGMYQYTDRNYIGSKGPFDANVAYKDYPAIVKQYGFNGYGKLDAYLEKCTVYPTYCKVTTTKSAPLNSLPRSASNDGSNTLVTAQAGQTYTAKALYRNTAGNYWYQITLDTGETAYLYGGHANYQESLDGDIIFDGTAPGNLAWKENFAVNGAVRASINTLDEVQVLICSADGQQIASAVVAASGNLCDLSGVTLDFAALEAGDYLYKVVAKYSGNYATAANEITEYSAQKLLAQEAFTVAQCAHQFTTTVIQPETCTVDGIMEHTCRNCGATNRTAIAATGHSYKTVTTDATCAAAGKKVHTCTLCGDSHTETIPATGHSYGMWQQVKDSSCTEDGIIQKTCAFCGDVQTTIVSAFGHSYETVTTNATCTAAGSKVHTCTVCGDSYTETIPAAGHSYGIWQQIKEFTCTAEGRLERTCTSCGYVQVQIVPAKGHDFVDGICGTCGAADSDAPGVIVPALNLDHPSLSFEGEVMYNLYFTADDLTSVAEMGLIAFNTKLEDGTIENADNVYPGYIEAGGMYMGQTAGVPARHLGDAVYFKAYARLTDGSYVYSGMVGYNAVVYAKSILKNSSNDYMKRLVVAMINYGAEAQRYFCTKEGVGFTPMNDFLTADQQALIEDYDTSMVENVVNVDSAKAGSLQYNGSSFAKRAPSVSFGGAFSINYYFTTANKPDGEVKLYYWTLEDYNAASVLLPKNATGSMVMTNVSGNQYWGEVAEIAAKELDETVFVLGVYSYNGTVYTTGVLNYHIGKYCTGLAAKDTSEQQDLAKATVVYGFYAKEYFANV